MARQGATAARWADDVAAEVRRLLAEQADDIEHEDPQDVASRMVESLPRRSPWNALGPFYSTRGVCRILGGISRQAVEDRRRRHRLIALRTSDGSWVYPSYQFDGRNRPIVAIVDAHRRLRVGRIDEWTAASALLGPQPELGGRSIVEHVRSGGDPGDYEDLLVETVAKNR
jgi:hypothetical protein